MKQLCGLLLLCVLAYLPLAARQSGTRTPAPVFVDDFERDLLQTGWTPVGWGAYGKNLLWSTQEPQEGTHCLAIVPREGTPIGGWESPPFAVTPRQYYRVTCQARTARPAYAAIFFYAATGALCEGDHYALLEPSTTWKAQEFYFATKYPGVTASLVFQPIGREALSVDAVRIEPVSAEAPLAWADAVYAGMPALQYTPPPTAGAFIPATLAKLRKGGPVRIAILGDSIANDLSNSLVELLLQREFPKARLEAHFVGRGGTGWNKHQHQVAQRILAQQPDLVVLLAISNDARYMVPPLERIVTETRAAAPGTEFLLITPHIDFPGDEQPHAGQAQREVLLQFARDHQLEVIDLLTAWNDYLALNGKAQPWLLRDPLHMNARGRQLTARIVTAHFAAARQYAEQTGAAKRTK